MKFEAKRIDLKLELTDLNGEEKVFMPAKPVSVSYVEAIVNKWSALEKTNKEKKVEGALNSEGKPLPKEMIRESNYVILAKQIKIVYTTIDIQWLFGNFNPSILTEIVTWLVNQMTDVKKNVDN